MSHTFNADKPLLDIKDDALGVATLATNMAHNIINMAAPEGFVIGLYGAWGSGKTTFINFIKQVIGQLDEDEKPLVLDFNPWLFSGHDDLIQRFIIELSRKLSPTENRIKWWRKWFVENAEEKAFIGEQLLTFAGSLASSSAIAGAALFGNPALAKGFAVLGKLSKKAHEQLSKQPPLSEQKSNICKSLRAKNKKLIVIIDDIDRLAKEEILSIFKMVKSVADFPNVIYLLSFDKLPVCNIVSDIQKCDGAAYLEKIIQYDIDLPQPDPLGVLKIFTTRIDPLIENPKGISFDTDRWGEIYRDYLRHTLLTPRQAIKLGNAFCVSYPNLVGEVNPLDLVSIEALRLFSPHIYVEIRRNPNKFTELGQKEFRVKENDPPYFESVFKLAKEHERDAIRSLLTHLFPRIEAAFSKVQAGSHRISEWRAKSRVCSEYHFPKYFNYSPLPDKFTDEELRNAIQESVQLGAFTNLMIHYSEQKTATGTTRIPEFLERLLDVIKVGQADNTLENIIRALIISGDSIIKKEDEERGWLRIDSELRITWVLLAAFERYSGGNFFDLIEQSYKHSVSIYILCRLTYTFGGEHGKYNDKPPESIRPGEAPYLSLEEITRLENMTLQVIRAAAVDGRLLNHIHMHRILWGWKNFTGKVDEPRAWVQEAASTDEGLIKLVINFSGITVVSNAQGAKEIISFQFDSLKQLFDIDDAYKRLPHIIKTHLLNENDLKIINAFIEAYERAASGKSERWD